MIKRIDKCTEIQKKPNYKVHAHLMRYHPPRCWTTPQRMIETTRLTKHFAGLHLSETLQPLASVNVSDEDCGGGMSSLHHSTEVVTEPLQSQQ